jgi:hypothetical protein
MSLDINLTNVESTTNKKTNLTDNSDTFYPTQKAVKTAVDAKFNTPTGTTAQYLRGDGSLETFPTIPDASDFVEKSDFTSHSILAKQSGASDPVAVSIGNNEILGRKSGGGSNIEGLSVSEVKSLLNYTASDVGAPSGSGSSTGTNTGDETQASILAKLGWFSIKDQVPGTASSGTSTTISKSIALPFVPTHLKFRVVGNKTNINGSYTISAYLSEVDNNITGTAILIAATAGVNGSVTYLPLNRHNFDIIGGNIIGLNSTTSQVTDDVQIASARQNQSIPSGSPLYLIFAVRCVLALDSARIESVEISNF